MKKKIFGVMLVGCLFLIMVLLTGCGNKEQNESPAGNAINNNTSQEENTDGIDVTNVYATSDNYAIAEANDKTYIINNKGEKQGTIDFDISDNTDITINDNGYVCYENTYSGNKILDKTGKVIYENNDNEEYEYITENNYTLRTSTKSTFESGDSEQKEIIDMSGNIIKTVGEESKYLGGNIWYISGDEYYLYNEKTNNIVNIDSSTRSDIIMKYIGDYNVLSDGGTFFSNMYITGDLKVVECPDSIYVNNEYYYNTKDYSIYKYDGTKVKDFATGDGFKYFYASEDKFYVQSGTGYFYVLDEGLNQIEEPNKLEQLNGTTKYVGNNCILNINQVGSTDEGYSSISNQCYLYDYKGNLIEDLGEGWSSVEEVGSNIVKVNCLKLRESTRTEDKISVGPQSTDKYINLYTGTILKVF